MAKLSTILDQIDNKTMLLPEFQRGYVWNRDQVRGLMRSLYLGYPVGSLLVWETQASRTSVRGSAGDTGTKSMLLDGQQRVTSLYGVMRGRPPEFFEGDAKAFTGLFFNVKDETFEFFAPTKMKDDPLWVDVTALFGENGVSAASAKLFAAPALQPDVPTYMERLLRLVNIKDREFHQESITGPDKTPEVVVEIFNKVNSGGTKLSKGDLALARICSEWAPARSVMRKELQRWSKKGFGGFTLDWLLRNVTALATGRSQFSTLEDVEAAAFADALERAAQHIDTFLEAASGRLGLDHDRVLLGNGGIPVISRYLDLKGGDFTDAKDRDRILYWFVHAGLWGRFAGSTETVLNQDYETVNDKDATLLIDSLERWRGGNLTIQPHDFDGWSVGSRFYPLLYLLTRVRSARDFGSGLPLHAEMLGKLSSLQVHHIFPKAPLYAAQYQKSQVNAVANFCFLTQKTNLEIGARLPEQYFAEVEAEQPGALASQWIPMDEALWKVENYPDFLAARRELLAEAANSFLDELRSGAAPEEPALRPVQLVEETDDPRTAQVKALVAELQDLGYSVPGLDHEIADPETGDVLAVAEAHWPDGLQAGQGGPVVLELDPEDSDIPRMRELGYEVFTSVDSLRGYVQRRNEEAAGVAEEDEETGERPDEDAGERERAFTQAMVELYEIAKGIGYHANHLLRMITDLGGVEAARRLIGSPVMSDGFTALWERGRLDLTVEALVLLPTWRTLFTPDELDRARDRLSRFGYRAAS